MKRRSTAILTIALAVVFAFSALVGCGGTGEAPKNQVGSVRIFTYTGNRYEGIKMDSVIEAIEEKVGVDISFAGAEIEDYYTVLSPMMGSLDWPDIIWSDPEASNGSFMTWADPDQEMLWNLDELIIGNEDRYPYLAKLIYSDLYKNFQFYDGHYVVPNVQTRTAWAIYYRKDWLEAIGFVDADGNARAPVTLDEFEEVMEGFTGKDKFTLKNGQKSGTTYGIGPNAQNFYVNPLYHAFGVPTDWDLDENGEVEYMYTTDEFKNYLTWMNAMYKKGWIDPVFNQNIAYDDRDGWYDGKIGCIMTNGESHMEWLVGSFEDANGKGNIIVGPPPMGTGHVSTRTGVTLGVDGARGYSGWGGLYGGYSITKATADPYKTLDLLEYLISPEGSMLRLYGIEGKHWNKDPETGKPVVDLIGRGEESITYFADVTGVDDKPQKGGLHSIGSLFGYAIDWDVFDETGEIAIATDIASLYPAFHDLVAQAIEYTQYLVTSKLINFTAYPATIDSMRRDVMNTASLYINQAIIGGKNLTSDWDAMLAACNSAGYSTVKAVMKESVERLGIA